MTDAVFHRLVELGYLRPQVDGDVAAEDAGILRFKKAHGALFTAGVRSSSGRDAAFDGIWGQVSQKLLDAPRDCSVPDIARASDGSEIEEARWPPECALELRFSADFVNRGMPGLTSEQTKHCILFALAQLNTMFELEPDGTIQDVVMQEFLRLGGDPNVDLFVLAVGTIAHEIMHALGGNHTPSDPDSVLYPSMRGQYILNRTDTRNFARLGYSKERPLRIVHVEWDGTNGTEIWARLKALPGGTLAWSMLSNGSCGQRAEQAYDSTVTWNRTRINLPPVTPPDGPDPPPDEEKTVSMFWAEKAGQEFRVVTGKDDGGVIEI